MINQGKLIGVLYLENNLARSVFAPARMAVLKLLASQAAISLENSRLYRDLEDREYKLHQIIETVPGLIWSTGPDGEPTHVSQRLLDYSGMRFEDFKQVGWKAFVHPDDFPQTAKAYYQAIQSGTSYQGVVRLRRADGVFRWHHARCEPLRDRQGRIIQWYGLSVDTDEGKKAEDLLRRSEAHLAEAQRLSYTGAVAYNGTAILFASEETYHIWGFDPAQGLPSREVVFQRILARQRDPGPAATIMTPDALRLRHAPVADCARYDQLRSA